MGIGGHSCDHILQFIETCQYACFYSTNKSNKELPAITEVCVFLLNKLLIFVFLNTI